MNPVLAHLFGAPKPPTVEAAGKVELANPSRANPGWGVGISRLAPAGYDFAPPVDVWSREAAMSIPTIRRARDLLCSAVAALPLTLWTLKFNDTTKPPIEQAVPPALWMARPDPNRTRQWLLSWSTDDLFFHGRAYWRVSSRYASTTYPSAYEWMPVNEVAIDNDGKVTWQNQYYRNTHDGSADVDANDVIEFLSPLDGLLAVGWRAIQTALNLDAAAERFSLAEIPAGWLSQRENSEPLDATELAEIASQFQAARQQRTIAALNPFLEWHESSMDPSRLQLVEARAHQALELSRLANIPAYLVGAPAGTGMTYLNAAQAKSDLIDFGALPYVQAIEQTLSGPNVTPVTQFVRLDANAWLRNPFTPNDNAAPNDAQIAYNPNTPPAPTPDPGGRPRQSDGGTGAL